MLELRDSTSALFFPDSMIRYNIVELHIEKSNSFKEIVFGKTFIERFQHGEE